MNKILFLPGFLTCACISAWAQSDVYIHQNNVNRDHQWTEYQDSDHFTIWYSSKAEDCASVTEAQRTSALNELEFIFDTYMKLGFREPFPGNATKLKMGVWVLRKGTNCKDKNGNTVANLDEGHAFGGTLGGAPGMWLSAGAVSDKWALAHEFMHGLQAMTPGMKGGNTNQGTNFTGWFYESHANLMPHQVYPTDIHYCSEMYTRTAHLYLGSTRNRYCNWQFFEYLMDQKGAQSVHDLWGVANASGADPFSEYMRQQNLSQKDYNDLFGDFASKTVIWDMKRGNSGSANIWRNNYNGQADRFKRQRYTYLESLEDNAGGDPVNNRYVSPFASSPQRYGFNMIRLYPDEGSGTVTVKFRGDVQTENHISNYSKRQNLEPRAENLPDDPGSDWRYRLVAVKGDATARNGAVSARYSDLKRASDGNPDITMTLEEGENQLYLICSKLTARNRKVFNPLPPREKRIATAAALWRIM